VAAAGGSLAVGAAVTSRAAAAALGGGEQLAPSAPALLSLGDPPPPPTFPEFPSWPGAAAGGRGRRSQLSRAPAGGCRALSPAPHSGCPSLAEGEHPRRTREAARRRGRVGSGCPEPPPRGGAGSRRGRPSAPTSAVTLASPPTSRSLVRADSEMGATVVAWLSLGAASDSASA
jgi:hypothetical protein